MLEISSFPDQMKINKFIVVVVAEPRKTSILRTMFPIKYRGNLKEFECLTYSVILSH
jgi:hypothetical protein